MREEERAILRAFSKGGQARDALLAGPIGTAPLAVEPGAPTRVDALFERRTEPVRLTFAPFRSTTPAYHHLHDLDR